MLTSPKIHVRSRSKTHDSKSAANLSKTLRSLQLEILSHELFDQGREQSIISFFPFDLEAVARRATLNTSLPPSPLEAFKPSQSPSTKPKKESLWSTWLP